MKSSFAMLFALWAVSIRPADAQSHIVTQLPTKDKVVALTFDACETLTPSHFDSTILDYLLAEKIPFAVFATGKFAVRNRTELQKLSRLDFVEIENHSYNHPEHLERLKEEEIADEIKRTDDTLAAITGKRSKYFRFTAGNCDERSLKIVEGLHYQTVHWSFESGDPDKHATPEHLIEWVLLKTKPGNILIFHINGRGYSTGKALPAIADALKKKGYRFVKLADYLTN